MNKLFVSIRSSPQVVRASGNVTEITCEGQKFEDSGLGDWTGFYDWLRNESGLIIGVRFWPFETAKPFLRAQESGSNISVERGALLVFFGSSRNFVNEISDDQDFEAARVLKSRSGTYGLLLGSSAL